MYGDGIRLVPIRDARLFFDIDFGGLLSQRRTGIYLWICEADTSVILLHSNM